METAKLKKFAQFARRSLLEQVSAKLKMVLAENSTARREKPKTVAEIEKAISKQPSVISHQSSVISKGKEPAEGWRLSADGLIERVAYIWFNRFCALRFMDVNRYTRIGVVSPAEGQFQPEILAEAKMGHIDEQMVHDKTRQQIFALLDGKAPSRDPQGEAYRLLVVAACNFFHRAMPFLFQRIDDYTELLMPDDLLSGSSILAYTREAMTPDACGAGNNQLSVISNQKTQADDSTDGRGLKADSSAAAGGVEIIGWLYQFYISEKKAEVFDGLKKNKKITPENIPAATQLFTPHWIVRYLVENSLGRLWMQNRPNSRLKERIEYYIEPAEENITAKNAKDAKEDKENNFRDFSAFRGSKDFLEVSSPEEIKICDPACGSGHMLTYAFDLLYAIYEEEGYEPAEIPEKILTHNLYGIEIDERAGELAAFALTMKARARQRRFFNKGVKPNIRVLENVHFDEGELKAVGSEKWVVGSEKQQALHHDLHLFEEADNFGSLLRPQLPLEDIQSLQKTIHSTLSTSHSLFDSMTHQKVLQALRQADYLSPKYHVVIANPPYMGGKGMNGRLAAWIKENYPDSKADLMTCFMERANEICRTNGAWGMINLPSWMFLSSFEAMRRKLLRASSVHSLLHLGRGIFGSDFGSVAFVFDQKLASESTIGVYRRLFEEHVQVRPVDTICKLFLDPNFRKFEIRQSDLFKIPGAPIAYWVSANLRNAFLTGTALKTIGDTRQGMATSDNNRFLREWYEVSYSRIFFNASDREAAIQSSKKWFPYNKGGAFRRWYGNCEYVLNWENDGEEVISYAAYLYRSPTRTIKSISEYFKPSISWSKVTAGGFSMRYFEEGFIFDVAGCSIFADNNRTLYTLLGFTNSLVAKAILDSISPTLNYEAGHVASLPVFIHLFTESFDSIPQELVKWSKIDWDSYETSWDFTGLPLLNPDYRQPTLKATFQKLRAHWREMTLEMQRLEEENNRIFIEAYGLQDELTPEVPLNEITLTCNPYYRYGFEKCEVGSEKWEEMEARLLQDTMRELVSYAVGCMFGRYSLDASGLILANQGQGIDDYFRIIEEKRKRPDSHQPSVISNHQDKTSFTDGCTLKTDGLSGFEPDDDNVIPLLDGDWFTDDITERFKQFLKVAFGPEHYEENLRFVEVSLNIKGKRNYSIRDYFLGELYTDHVKRYKKRPIYWMFSSPKGSFNALIYMHRYRPDTVSVVLNDYLREFRTKLTAHKDHLEAVSISASASQGEKTKALKEIEKITKRISELEEYEREVLYPLATEQVEIDLDDGVKVNYPKFGKALKKIPGL